MTNQPTPTAKQQVLDWVRSKNPQTLELKEGCVIKCGIDHRDPCLVTHVWRPDDDSLAAYCYCVEDCGTEIRMIEDPEDTVEILGSDMGLQELLIAIGLSHLSDSFCCSDGGWIYEKDQYGDPTYYGQFDLTKNLHNQTEEFYTAILPLIV